MPLIATNCIVNDRLYPVHEKVRYVSEKTYDTWFRGHPEPGDVIFTGTPTIVTQLRTKLALNEEVFRVIFTQAPEPKPAQ